jgi:hypothetical protein
VNRLRATNLFLLVAVLALLSTGCAPGADDGTGATTATTAPPTTPTTTTTAQPEFSAELTVTIGTTKRPREFEATLRCGADPTGTGYLAGLNAGACDFLRQSNEARTLLIEGPAPGRVCTEIYGGAEVADISGTLDGSRVGVAINRANGCGIADWDLLRPILVEPYDLDRQNNISGCSGATAAAGGGADQGELPSLVSNVRAALVDGARSCDYEGLAARATSDGTNVSFGGSDDPAALWRDLESLGATPLADLVVIFQLAPGTMDDGQGTVFYVWPAVAALDDWNQATAEQRSELADLFGAERLADWDLFGGYIGYRVGITDSGRWAFFVEGD